MSSSTKNTVNLSIISEIEITYNPKVSASLRPKVSRSQDAYRLFFDNFKNVAYKESMYIMLLNRANRVLGISKISEGGISSTTCDPKVVFQTALLANSSGFILCHNHPSETLKPSEQDLKLTNEIKQAGKFLELPLLDHLIIVPDEGRYYSFADEGVL